MLPYEVSKIHYKTQGLQDALGNLKTFLSLEYFPYLPHGNFPFTSAVPSIGYSISN